jgi:hypothetical protein
MHKYLLKIVENNLFRSNIDILCADEKSSGYKYRHRDEAISYNFIRYGNDYFIPTLSIDIDYKISNRKIKEICKANKLPTPNFIVHTTKGKHIHWVFENPISVSNIPSHNRYKYTLRAVIAAFGGDPNATAANAGRVWRNPLTHRTTLLKKSYVQLSEFPKFYATTKESNKRKRVKVRTSKNLRAVRIGERNDALFEYTRKVAYRHYNHPERNNIIHREAYYANSLIRDPLDDEEVDTIIASVIKFIENKYVPRTASEDVLAYNRKLAQKKKEKTLQKLLSVISSHPLLTIKALKKMSVRAGAKLLGVSNTTFHNYRGKLKEALKEALRIIVVYYQAPIDTVEEVHESIVTLKFNPELKFGFTWGVP